MYPSRRWAQVVICYQYYVRSLGLVGLVVCRQGRHRTSVGRPLGRRVKVTGLAMCANGRRSLRWDVAKWGFSLTCYWVVARSGVCARARAPRRHLRAWPCVLAARGPAPLSGQPSLAWGGGHGGPPPGSSLQDYPALPAAFRRTPGTPLITCCF